MMKYILLTLCPFYFVSVSKCGESDLNVNITQLFVHKISPDKLSWNKKERENNFHYIITTMEGPDIPPWLYVKYNEKSNNLFIYGAAPKELDVEALELQICITSLHSYRTKCSKLKIWFNFIEDYAKYEIRLRISNLGIEEMLNEDQQASLIEIFEEHFWRTSKGKLYFTFLTTFDEAGYHLPLNPNDTAGVIVHLGSTANFSEELLNLQNETMPLTKHCPSFSKRIAVERFFRPKNFIIDWCSFQIINLIECAVSSTSNQRILTNNCIASNSNQIQGSYLKHDEEFLVIREALPQSPVHGIITLFIIVPSVFFGLVITSWLSSFMCFNNKTLNDPFSDDYFETIFFVCEDVFRKQKSSEEPVFMEEDVDSEILFQF